MNDALVWAYAMGAAAVFNPCGVAMLPASLAWLSGTTTLANRWGGRVWHGLLAGAGMALGFVLVVAALGLVVRATGVVLGPILRPVMMAISVGLVGAGILVALGLFHLPLVQWLGTQNRGTPRIGTWGTFVGAGVLYGIAALSCTLPLFLAALLPAVARGWAALGLFLVGFGGGTLTVLVVLSEATLFARDAVSRALARVAIWINPVLGTVVFGAGGYLLYYWVWGPGRFLG